MARDARLMDRLLGQWVHRQGVSRVAALSQELEAAEPEGWTWWQELQSAAPQPVLMERLVEPIVEPLVEAPAPVVPPQRLEPQLPRATRPAPAPSHPAVAQLRAWLPDQESRRAA